MVLRVPPRFQAAEMGKLDKRLFKPVIEYAKDFDTNLKGGLGLLLSGPNGVGKTYALCALTREAHKPYVLAKKYFDYEVTSAADLIERIPILEDRKVMDERRSQSWVETYCRVPWLVIDDLGKEYRGGAFHEQVVYKLGKVLRARNGRCLVTHVSTNLPLKATKTGESIPSVYGASVMSLLTEMTRGFHVVGADRRKQR